MKTLKPLMLITTLTLLILYTCGCSQSPQGTEKSFSGTMEEIAYPQDAGYINNIKFGEKGELYLSMAKPNKDGSRSAVSAWKREKESESWTKLYEKNFDSSNTDETISANLHFMEDGVLIRTLFVDKDDFHKSHLNFYYMKDFDECELIEVLHENKLGILSYSDFLMKEKVVARDSETSTVKILNLEKDTVEEISEVKYCFFSYFDGKKIYMAYMAPYELTEEEKKAFEAGIATDNPERYARGKIYDTESKSWSESDVLNEVSIMLFEKWTRGSLTSYDVFPIFCKDTFSEEEAYYIANNDGVCRVSEAGEELIYFNPDWNSKKNSFDEMLMSPDGEIYICGYIFDNKTREVSHKLMKITS